MNRREFIGGCAAGAVAAGLPGVPGVKPLYPFDKAKSVVPSEYAVLQRTNEVTTLTIPANLLSVGQTLRITFTPGSVRIIHAPAASRGSHEPMES